ncbi:MAG: hypothetical protein PHF67_03265 [Candidatus Nanoarchaeia archaeon]|nr:hypothetical protein [Candidatus Nanoarchaeia archaeon]
MRDLKQEFYRDCTVEELFGLAEDFIADTRAQLGLCARTIGEMKDELDLFEYRSRLIREDYGLYRN